VNSFERRIHRILAMDLMLVAYAMFVPDNGLSRIPIRRGKLLLTSSSTGGNAIGSHLEERACSTR
jgi:hypothetical protein